MADIVLRNGKTLVYNEVKEMFVENGAVLLQGKGRKESFLIALIPLDTIERAEYEKPCKIIYPRSKKKK